MKFKTIHVILMLLLASTLIACGSSGVPAPSTSTPEPQTGITLVDALGRTVTFEQPPQRIAIAGKANFMLNDAVYLFPEASERIIALTKASQNANPFIGIFDPDYEEKTRFTVESSAEEIAAAQPDVVLLKSFMAESLGNALETLAIPVVYVDLETPEQYQRDLQILGRLFAEPERAAQLGAFYDAQIARVTATLADSSERPRVLVLQYSTKGGTAAFLVPPVAWIQTELVQLAGGDPLWIEAATGGGWAVVGLEQIAAWQPDKIFLIDYFNNVDETLVQLTTDPQWQELDAMQNGELYAFPKDHYSWDQPDSRWALGLLWLAQQIHPAPFAQLDMRAEFYAFYETMYGLDAATVDEHILPLIEGDAWSLPDP